MRILQSARRMGLAGAIALGGSALWSSAQAQQAPAKHHSVVKGAVVGAIAGKVAGGHTKLGAVTGAIVQHHRNKKARGK